jgi:hypothetical protein
MRRLWIKASVVACLALAATVHGPRDAACQPLVFIGSWPSTGIPLGLVVGPTGSLYMADEHNGIGLRVFSQGGVPLGTFDPGGAIESYGVGVLSDQSVLFTDYYGNRVLRFAPDGTYLSEFATGGSSAWLAVDESDNIYVTDDQSDKVRKFSSSGALLAQWYVKHPAGVAYDNGQVFVTEMFDGHIQVFSSAGVPQGSFLNGATFAQQLTASGTGQLYLGDHGTHSLRSFSTAGALEWTLGPNVPGYAFPDPDLFSVAQAPDGTLFVGDFNNRNVLIFVPAPVATARDSFGALKARYRGGSGVTQTTAK